ncbi:hypothetical protein [Streptomyces aureocirculatus]|uniref:hypothetical protein n=1 Tax=Streptomyces aureocirculatus TaxID=67275 RepID=UPI0004C6F984|nr:hypothetical protein [Streptomyces aureocirculatus]
MTGQARQELIATLLLFLFGVQHRWLLPTLAARPIAALSAAEDQRFAAFVQDTRRRSRPGP